MQLPEIDWIEVPEGAFVYQRGETRELPTFWISRYTVTNAQFQAFVDDGGYESENWWNGLRRPTPDDSYWPQTNRPRTNVDWYEAVAFTRWFNARLRLVEGAIHLPTEHEWEKAARGPNGLLYPWGSSYQSGVANVKETERNDGPWYLEQTTAVGLYPHGRSVYGVEDMAGTVGEWCLNKYIEPGVTLIDTSNAPRVLRGGSWLGGPLLARAVVRNAPRPRGRNAYWGFRVASSVPRPMRHLCLV